MQTTMIYKDLCGYWLYIAGTMVIGLSLIGTKMEQKGFNLELLIL